MFPAQLKRSFIAYVAVLVAASATSAQPAVAPNIVFFLADDMGIGDTSAYQDLTGNPNHFQLDTPNMERLATMGTRFTDAHSGAAVCTPTRLSFLTGIHSFRSPQKQRTSFVNQDVIGTLLPGERQTIGGMLQEAGYGSYGVGKWHMGMQVDFANHTIHEGPVQAGFDHYTGTPGNFPGDQGIMVDNQLLTYDSNFDLVPYGDPSAIPWNPTGTDFDPTSNPAITEAIQQTNLDAAQQYLADHVTNRSEDPFFLYYASHANHTPFLAGATLDGETVDGHTKDGTYLDVPTTTNGQGEIVPTGPDYGNVGLSNHWTPYLETDGQGNVTEHGPGERFRAIDENDVALGKLLDYLEATDDPRSPGNKLVDNTLIIFTSDNGSDIDTEPSVGALPQSSNDTITDIAGKKATFQEGGTRVPYIAAWAGQIEEDATSDALIGITDTYATVAEILGRDLDTREAVDSESVLDAWTGESSGDARDSALVYKTRDRLIIRDGEYKLIVTDPDADRNGSKFDGNLDFADLEVFRFYDLANDLNETTDLKNDPAQITRIATMLTTLQTYVDQGYSRTGAAANLNGVNFHGGDILDAANYLGYGDVGYDPDNTGNFELPRLTKTNPSFIYMDGTADVRPDGVWLIQGNGTVTFTGNQAGLEDTRWELRDGTIDATGPSAFQINDGSEMIVRGGTLDASGHQLRLRGGNGRLEIRGGQVLADKLTVGQLASTTAGAKVIEFGLGDGTLTLTNADPISFGDDGDAANDYINFITGSTGRIVSSAASPYYLSLWDNDQLRVDGVAGSTISAGFTDFFAVTDLGGGLTELSLIAALAALTGDYNADGFVSQADLDLVLLNWGASGLPTGFETGNLPGGGPFDGLISQNELDGVLLNWGNGTSPATNAIPEPASGLLLAGTALLLGRRVRRDAYPLSI